MSSLADEILASKGKRLDLAYTGGVTLLSENIEKAQRFVFSEDATVACRKLAESRPSSLLEATKFCRLPFENVWIEWVPTAGLRNVRDPEWPEEHKVYVPSKIGCFLTALDGTFKRFGMALAWSIPWEETSERVGMDVDTLKKEFGTGINISPLGWVVNWYEDWPIFTLESYIAGQRKVSASKVNFSGMYAKKFANDSRELEAARALDGNTIPVIVPFADPHRTSEKTGFLASEKRLNKIMEISERDWQGEYHMVIAMLCLLNSQNCVDITKKDIKKLSKARVKRGKLPLLSYSTVEIKLSKQQQRQAEELGLSKAQMRQHIVRGHFKIRKSGVFWWRPFIRGDALLGEVKREGYRVAA